MYTKLVNLIITLLITGNILGNDKVDIEELKNKLSDKTLPNIEKGKLNFQIGEYYYKEVEDALKSKQYFLNSYKFLTDTKEKKYFANAVNYLGICYEVTGRHDSSIYFFNRYLDISKDLKDSLAIGDAYNNIGMVYEFSGQFEKAAEYYLYSSKIKDQLTDTVRQISANISLGDIYRHLEKYTKALRYFNDAILLNEKIQDETMNARIYNSMAIVYKNKGLNDSALVCYKISLENSKAIDWKKGIAAALSNMANVYEKMSDYEKSLDYNLKSLDIEKEMNHHYGIMLSYTNIGRVYNVLGNYKLAESNINEALVFAKDEQNYQVLKEIYDVFYQISVGKRDYKKALDYFELYVAYKDSTYNEETTNRISDLEAKYQNEKKKQKIKNLELNDELLKKKNQLAQEKIDKQKNEIRLVIIILIIVFIVLFIVVMMYVQRRKTHLRLVQMNLDAVKCEKQMIASLRGISSEEKYKGSNLDKQKKQELINDLLVLMEERKFFLTTNFTIEDLSQELETNRQYLSQIINEHFHKNFNSFVNEFRIREARRLLMDSDNEKYTIEGIANTVGFNSRTSFISAFKKYTGVTPSFFKKNNKDFA